jgi:hypothetical protein
MVIVLVSIIVMGGATEPLLRFLKVDMGVDEEEYMKVWRSERQLKGRFHTFGASFLCILQFDDTKLAHSISLSHRKQSSQICCPE